MPNRPGLRVADACDSRIASVQSSLRGLGYNVEPDCKLGPQTRRAIADFQQRRLEAPTGQLTRMQLRALNEMAH